MNKGAAKPTARDVKAQQQAYYQDSTIASYSQDMAGILKHASPVGIFSEEGFRQVPFSNPEHKEKFDALAKKLDEYRREKYPLLFYTDNAKASHTDE